jgi:RNA polymerase sigma factor (sigma-70 family)
MQTDAELLARIIVEDDREAFEVILKKYQSPLRAFFRKMCGGDEALADDLAQETFFNAYRGLRSFKGGSQFLTWLYAIAKNVFYQHLRTRTQHEELGENDGESYQMDKDVSLDISKCMLLLNPEERMILSLSYAEGLSQTEVAELMGIPLGTVKTHTLRAKDKLRSTLTAYQTRSV